MGMTGANTASLDQIRQAAGQTGQLAVQTATQTKAATQTAKGEVDDVVTTLRQQFGDTLDHLEQVADQADQQVANSGWEGQARENALRASTDFRSGINKLSGQSREALGEFHQQLDQQVTTLNEDISGKFTSLMQQAEEAFSAFARAVQSYSSDLQATDSSVTYG